MESSHKQEETHFICFALLLLVLENGKLLEDPQKD
jgi:hypothetical protein